jgi:hypothetical protein
MQLNDEQKKRVSAWIADGMKLSDIQGRLAEEFGIRLTYMDARLLVDDMKLTPKDVEPPAPVPAAETIADAPPSLLAEPTSAPAGKLSLSVDQIARPGAMVSGSVIFSDGKSAKWHVDQQGRLGVVPDVPGYRPPPADVEEFQVALDRELQKMGF